MPVLDEFQRKRLQKANYKIFGKNRHSAAKLCLWTKRSIKTGEQDFCYKQKFYGIKSHRCLQMTPVFTKCNLRCSHCWRDHRYFTIKEHEWDEPEEIFKESIKAQRELLTGLGGVSHSEKHLKEAFNPNQVAISLDGEPFFYPYLDELIGIYKKNNFSVFLVTNGTFSDKLMSLKNMPTNLYLSLTSNSKEMFQKTQHPLRKGLWEKILESLKILKNINTTTVIRLTLVKDMNMVYPEKYAQLIRTAEPNFIEVKAWMCVGGSTQRLKYEQMPSHEEVKEFSKKLSDNLGYTIKDEKENSRVVVLRRN